MRIRSLLVTAILASALTGCGGGDQKDKTKAAGGPGGATPAATLPANLIATAAPGEAKNVIAAKADAKEGDEIVLRGVIGGSEKPFVEGRAVVNIIDLSVPSCADNGEECPTPWDYCCVPPDEKTKAMATVQVTDAEGKPLKIALSSVSQLKPYSVVVVKGKVAARPDANALIVNASSIYIEKEKK